MAARQAESPSADLSSMVTEVLHASGRKFSIRRKFKQCSCDECQQQYFQGAFEQIPGQDDLTDTAANDLIQNYLRSIQEDKAWLKKCVGEYGTRLVNTWCTQKSQAQRKALLCDIFPNAHRGGWSLFEYAAKKGCVWNEENEKFWFMFYLSTDSLANDRSKLLRLLHTRTTSALEDWFAFDLIQTEFLCKCQRWRCKFNPNCVRMHGPNIGKLTQWQSDHAHRRDILGFPLAETVLFVQKEIFKLLRSIVLKLIKQGDPFSGCQKWETWVSSNFRNPQDLEVWSEFDVRPFSDPLTFDIDRLLKVAKAKSEEAEDILWLMQTDARYLQNEIRSRGNSKVRQSLGKKKSYSFINNSIPVGPMIHALIWGWIFEECCNVQKIQHQCAPSLGSGQRVLQEYDHALWSLQLLVQYAWNHFTEKNGNEVLISAQFEDQLTVREVSSQYVSEITGRRSTHGVYAFTKGTGSEAFRKNRLHWCLRKLVEPEGHIDHSWLFSYFDEWLRNPNVQHEKMRFEPQVLMYISDMAACMDILRSLKCARPKATEVPREVLIKRNCSRHWWRTVYVDDVQNSMGQHKKLIAMIEEMDQLILPHGKKDQLYLDRFDEAHQLLNRFWKEARTYQRKFLAVKKFSTQDKEKWIDKFKYCLEKQHLEEVAQERTSIIAAIAAASNQPQRQAKSNVTTEEIPDWVLDRSENPDRTSLPPQQLRLKVKTHGIPREQGGVQDGATHLPTDFKTSQTPIALNSKSYKLIKRMFPKSSDETAGSEIDWSRFVSTMADIGFSATQAGGSAVAFQGEAGRVVFHRPHPVPKLNPQTIQWFGKRLKKRCGLDRENFVCKVAE
ncbi:MAG: hypothetical protein Q9227_002133 [Pyrenula ochraceoflavens]